MSCCFTFRNHIQNHMKFHHCFFRSTYSKLRLHALNTRKSLVIQFNWINLPNGLTFEQLCFHVMDQSWNNVDTKLKMKQYLTSYSQLCRTLIQSHCPTLKQRQNNVERTSKQRQNNIAQRRYNAVLTLFRRSFDVS